mmetsp:Transcript_7198/g.11314  ORF Transcript_7198/g.11314 Transcript_7198/m.11314 type:complete len:200 (-) Transcript_7198:29-628(-)
MREMCSRTVGLVQVMVGMKDITAAIAILSNHVPIVSSQIALNHHRGTVVATSSIEITAGKITRSQIIRPKTTTMEETTTNGKGEDLTLALSLQHDKCTQVSRTTKISTGSDLIKTSVMIIVKECITMAMEGVVTTMKEAREIIMKAAIITTATEESIMAIHPTSVSGRETIIICRPRFKRKRTECIILLHSVKFKSLNE